MARIQAGHSVIIFCMNLRIPFQWQQLPIRSFLQTIATVELFKKVHGLPQKWLQIGFRMDSLNLLRGAGALVLNLWVTTLLRVKEPFHWDQ